MDLARLERAFFYGCHAENVFLSIDSSNGVTSAVRLSGYDTHQAKEGILMHTAKVLEYLKKHGQLLDSDIAAATSISLDDVRASLSELSASGDISSCTITSYLKGKKVEGLQCRLSGFIPRPAPGRKPGVK